MLKTIKSKILCSISFFFSFLLRQKGIKVGDKCNILGYPKIDKRKGGSIVLGNKVTLNSMVRFNPLMEAPVKLVTLCPTAIIELKDSAGISGSSIVASSKISIGEYTIIGPGTVIYDAISHDYSPEIGWSGTKERSGRPITIGNKCYIGAKCLILNGVTIGDNCIISAGSVVNRNVPAGHKASGNPVVITPLPKILGGIR